MGKKGKAKKPDDGRKVVCRNKRALHEYFIEDRIEAGLVLLGTEVKSLREGKANLQDAYASIEGREAWLINSHINEWSHGTHSNHEPERKRKLLLHQREIHRLRIQLEQRGYTLVALSIYFTKGNRAKVELGLARGKHQYDKRASIKDRDQQRDAEREMERG